MHLTAILFLVYGIVVAIGGIMGYVKTKSLPSLISGVVAALIEIIAAVLFQHHPRLSLLVSVGVTLVLTIVMLMRFQTTKKPMPALPVAAVSIVVFAISVIKLVSMLAKHAS
jgi:uncharacterized membrane protein (UPF0136 family)